ncbi:MAG: hypothetical protein JXB05_24495 [Myxococcaceae bacterium]|nr:hypothetical protein [Myxococcaceae bacterium]
MLELKPPHAGGPPQLDDTLTHKGGTHPKVWDLEEEKPSDGISAKPIATDAHDTPIAETKHGGCGFIERIDDSGGIEYPQLCAIACHWQQLTVLAQHRPKDLNSPRPEDEGV